MTLRPSSLLLAALVAIAPAVHAGEYFSTWRHRGKLDGSNINPTRVVRDGRMTDASTLLLALDGRRFDPEKKLQFHLHTPSETLEIEAYDITGERIPVTLQKGGAFTEARPGEIEFQPFEGVSFTIEGRSAEKAFDRVEIHFDAKRPISEAKVYFSPAHSGPPANMAPAIHPPAGEAAKRAPVVEQLPDGFELRNAALKARFSTREGLRLESLWSEYAGKELLAEKDKTQLFLVDPGKGRAISAKDWPVKEVRVNGNRAEVVLEGGTLSATFTATITDDQFRLGLTLTNHSDKPESWTAVFPQIGGISISDQPQDDYYCYPYFGGIIQTIDAELHQYYSANEALWQMVSLFSPSKGSGLAIRSVDPSGLVKGVRLDKGLTPPVYSKALSTFGDRLPKNALWTLPIPRSKGSNIAFDYQRYHRGPGESYRYPDVVIEAHPGDWKEAMKRYTAWARNTWEFRKPSPALNHVWLTQTIIATNPTEAPVQKIAYDFKTKEWYSGYRKDGIDMGEFRHWQEWSEEGPFGVSLKEGLAETVRQMHGRWRYFFFHDPVRNRLMNAVNDGDYDYNPSLGGLEGLKEGIAIAHREGALTQFYVNCFIVDSTTRMGKTYGKKHSIVNPWVAHTPGPLPETPGGDHLITYAKWSMCTDNADYQRLFAENMARIVRDTQVDALRIDQMGYTGFVCLSKEHEHLHAEPGEHAAMQGMYGMLQQTRAACEKEKPDILILAEYAGSDRLTSQLNGALQHEMRKVIPGLRPVPLNVYRFAFPELTIFENVTTSHSLPDRSYLQIMLWNGVSLFQRYWPEPIHRMLRENSDALHSMDVEPLTPTLRESVYANTFRAKDKIITTLMSLLDEPVTGPVLPVLPGDEGDDWHYVDLLTHQPLTPEGNALALPLERKQTAVVGAFRRQLRIERDENGLIIHTPQRFAGATLALCDASGVSLRELPADASGEQRISELPEGIALVKLRQDDNLADIAFLPAK